MIGENEERWRKLCEEAVKEQDSDHLLELVRQITQMLADKERRLLDEVKRQNGSS